MQSVVATGVGLRSSLSIRSAERSEQSAWRYSPANPPLRTFLAIPVRYRRDQTRWLRMCRLGDALATTKAIAYGRCEFADGPLGRARRQPCRPRGAPIQLRSKYQEGQVIYPKMAALTTWISVTAIKTSRYRWHDVQPVPPRSCPPRSVVRRQFIGCRCRAPWYRPRRELATAQRQLPAVARDRPQTGGRWLVKRCLLDAPASLLRPRSDSLASRAQGPALGICNALAGQARCEHGSRCLGQAWMI